MTSKHVAEKGKKPTFERPVRLLRNVRSTNGYRGFNGKEALGGCALIAAGGGALAGLLHAAHNLQFDTLLVSSKAIYNVLTGLHSIGIGLGQTTLGLIQMLGFTALAALSVMAVLAVVSGSVRLGANALPQLNLIWNLLSSALQVSLKALAAPLGGLNGRSPVSARRQAMASDATDIASRRQQGSNQQRIAA
jgi:hypothetical protein